MCGIAGIIHFDNRPAERRAVLKMTCAMAHRGPDADSVLVDGNIGLGHRRLSIIDLSDAASQPFTDHSGRFVMVFNGEMYNFKSIRKMLPDYPFRTEGDTEVLIAAFAKWGVECIQYFEGMFAFAVWDRQEKELTLVRDRLGVKPLYYYLDNSQMVFSSEIRSILATDIVEKKLDRRALNDYFSYQSIGHPFSAIQGICQLEAASYVKIKDRVFTEKLYWDVTDPKNTDFDYGDRKSVQQQINDLMAAAVEKRLVSDVPVGAFLSGGIDSSAVVGLMAKVSSERPRTFNISFNEKEYDESAYAEIIAKKFNTIHTKINLEPTVLLEELENALSAMDIPSADGINTYVVSKAIRNAGITVALSGIGGDELFAGYPFFKQFTRLQEKRGWYKGTGLLRKAATAFIGGNSTNKERVREIINAPFPDIEYAYPVSRQILTPSFIRRVTHTDRFDLTDTSLFKALESKKKNIAALPLLSQVSVAEYLGYTQHTLLKDTDQMSMAVSLEVREPFFDHKLIEYVLGVPDKLKYPDYPKSLLVESLSPLLPDEIVHRKKQGFLFPWNTWMKRELKTFCEQRLQNLAQRPFIDGGVLMNYWKRFLQNDKRIRWPELWLFVVLEYWMEKNGIE